MITSNINELQFLAKVKKDELNNKNNDFLNEVKNSEKEDDFTTSKTNSLTYENIKDITLDEIDFLFINEDDKQMAKNLRLATLFTDDKILGEAMFNTVLGQPFELGYSYLFDRYEDKHNYLFSNNNKSTLSELLHKSMANKLENKNSTDVISEEYLDEILLEINSFSFLDAMRNTSKNQYDRYEDDEDYSYLYNDYNLKYQELVYKYQEIDNINKNIINQF